MKGWLFLLALWVVSLLTACRSSSSGNPLVDVYGTNQATNHIYVSPGGLDAPGRGTREKPFQSIQYALIRNLPIPPAGSNGNTYTVYLESGRYTPGYGLNLSDSGIRLPKSYFETVQLGLLSLVISGGWNSDFSSRSGATILDGEHKLRHLFRADWNILCYSGIRFDQVTFTRGGIDPSTINPALALTNYDGETNTSWNSVSPSIFQFQNCVFSNFKGTHTTGLLGRMTNAGGGNIYLP